MREIRFKAWSKIKKAWLHDSDYSTLMIDLAGNLNSVQTDSCETPFRDIDDFVLIQFTGLKDKNGKDIFEGDVLKSWYSRDTSGKDIFFTQEVVKYEISQYTGEAGYELLFLERAEVIGNIYENPDLLT